ncbi:hypothetical protein AB0L49_50405 [Streptomyces antimycoticus]|nr:hypothetical protein [Streptomyces antimycoticus]
MSIHTKFEVTEGQAPLAAAETPSSAPPSMLIDWDVRESGSIRRRDTRA